MYSRCLEILHGSVSELTCSKAHHVTPKLHKRVCHMSHIPSSFIECASDFRADFRKSGRRAKCQKNRISKRRPRTQVM